MIRPFDSQIPIIQDYSYLTPNLPKEVWVRIFSYLPDIQTQHAINLSCKQFRKLSALNLFKNIVKETTEPAGENYHLYLCPPFVPMIMQAFHAFKSTSDKKTAIKKKLFELSRNPQPAVRNLVAFCIQHTHLTFAQSEQIQKNLNDPGLAAAFESLRLALRDLEKAKNPDNWLALVRAIKELDPYVRLVERIFEKDVSPTLEQLKHSLDTNQESLKDYPDLILIRSIFHGKKMKDILNNAKDFLDRVSPELVQSIVEISGGFYEFLPERHRKNADIAYTAAKSNWRVLRFLPANLLKNEDIMIRLLNTYPQALFKKISPELLSEKSFWIKAINRYQTHNSCYQYVVQANSSIRVKRKFYNHVIFEIIKNIPFHLQAELSPLLDPELKHLLSPHAEKKKK